MHTCKLADPIAAAEQLMRTNRIRRVLIVDGSKRPIGILSVDDLAHDASLRREEGIEREFVRTMAAICAPRLAA